MKKPRKNKVFLHPKYGKVKILTPGYKKSVVSLNDNSTVSISNKSLAKNITFSEKSTPKKNTIYNHPNFGRVKIVKGGNKKSIILLPNKTTISVFNCKLNKLDKNIIKPVFKKNTFIKHSSFGIVKFIDFKGKGRSIIKAGNGQTYTTNNSMLSILTKDDKKQFDDIISSLTSGTKYIEIIKKYGFKKSTFLSMIKMMGYDFMKDRKNKRLDLINKVKKSIEKGENYSDIIKKYNLDSKIIHRFTELGYSPSQDYINRRNSKMGDKYDNGTKAKKLTSEKEKHVKTVSGVYGVVSAKLGIYKHPEIKRGVKGLLANKETIKRILKYKKDGLKFREIANKLNEEGFKTLTGLPFSDHHVIAKYNKVISNNHKIKSRNI